MGALVRELWLDEGGTTAVEYALLMSLVVLAGVAAWRGLGNAVGNLLEQCSAQLADGGS